MILGYDWPRLHAAVNDLPPALLPVSVLFDLLAVWLRRDSLRVAAFWTLIAGVLGTAGAIGAGLMAEDVVQHSEAAHSIMDTHETLAWIVLVIFGLLAVWRIVRRGVWGPRELPVALTAGVIGVAILTYTAKLGGELMFDHAVGITTSRLEQIPAERAGHEHGEPAAPAAMPMPAAPPPESVAPRAAPAPGPRDTTRR